MPAVIVSQLPDGGVDVLHPAPGISADAAAAASIPSGVEWRLVDSSDLPPDEKYRSAWVANFDDQPCVVVVDEDRKALVDSQHDTAQNAVEFESWWTEQIEQGFRSSGGILLGLTTDDVTLLTGNFVLAKEAAALSLDIPPVIDKDGVPHALDMEDLTALMLEYGQHRAALSAEYAQRKAATNE